MRLHDTPHYSRNGDLLQKMQMQTQEKQTFIIKSNKGERTSYAKNF